MMQPRRSPHKVRFGLLTGLCYALREHGCASTLVCPWRGESVLYVPYPASTAKPLAVTAVEHHDRWVFAFGSCTTGTGDVREAAARVTRVVGAR
ncbi:hypothetical protein DFJ69_3703 [Thermomonospora umbrina]|uniref:Uncharacterized protein n=2 Tax=Thermomonospora umbrina TaxID=111806 RepID=A0A3D9SQJ6_9ACTN|nr:hypothetical protein DFJ69_3703 [Thermomonospora umbrina]